jgi:hypothetical protein
VKCSTSSSNSSGRAPASPPIRVKVVTLPVAAAGHGANSDPNLLAQRPEEPQVVKNRRSGCARLGPGATGPDPGHGMTPVAGSCGRSRRGQR